MKVGVVGGGTMGSGIAIVTAIKGLSTVVREPTQELLDSAKQRIEQYFDRQIQKGQLSEAEVKTILDRISFSTNLSDFSDCSVIVEAIPEELALKQETFVSLDELTSPETILATNTSSLPITQIAAAVKRPQRVIGLHFFNPVPLMPLVEVIPALQTDETVVQHSIDFCKSIGKIPVKVADSPGFVVTRVLYAGMNEATLCLQENVATADAIDGEAKAFGLPMGIFVLADVIGLDILRQIGKVMKDAFGDRLKPSALIEVMVKRNWLGRKSGKGFYDYATNAVNPELSSAAEQARGSGYYPAPTTISPKDAIERIILAMVKETFLCWQEGIATPTDIDTAMRLGTNFPEAKGGGPLHYADQLGLPRLLSSFERWRSLVGDRFHPPYKLKLLIAAGLKIFS